MTSTDLFKTFFADLTHQMAMLAPNVGMALGIFALSWLASVLLGKFVNSLSQRTDYNTRFVLRLAARTLSIAVMIFGSITALGTMGINISALVAGLGLTGFALGFALKDVLANFVAGVLILLYRPFGLNDYITVTGLDGRVTEIDLRYTTLEKEGQMVLIPNSVLFTNSILLQTRSAKPAPEEHQLV